MSKKENTSSENTGDSSPRVERIVGENVDIGNKTYNIGNDRTKPQWGTEEGKLCEICGGFQKDNYFKCRRCERNYLCKDHLENSPEYYKRSKVIRQICADCLLELQFMWSAQKAVDELDWEKAGEYFNDAFEVAPGKQDVFNSLREVLEKSVKRLDKQRKELAEISRTEGANRKEAEKKIGQLEHDLESLSKKYMDAKAKLGTADSKLDDLKKQLKDKNDQANTLQIRIDKAEVEIEKQVNKIGALNSEINDKNARLTKSEENLNSLKVINKDVNDDLSRLTTDLTKATEQLHKKDLEITNSQSKLQEIKDQLKADQERNQHLEADRLRKEKAEQDRKQREEAARQQREAEERKRVTPGALTAGPLSGMQFAAIPGGTFLMGAPESEEGSDDEERPQHKVTLKPFHMQTTPVTQSMWEEVMGENPSSFKGSDRPVEEVSWDDIQGFLKKLNSLHPGRTYRLPSESEWEYACRAGTTTRFYSGDSDSDLDSVGWFEDNSDDETHPVGQKRPNSWGLYDMHGNVWEWCGDVWHGDYKGAPSDGSVWTKGGDQGRRVLRGGSLVNYPKYCRSAYRNRSIASLSYINYGFRLVFA